MSRINQIRIKRLNEGLTYLKNKIPSASEILQQHLDLLSKDKEEQKKVFEFYQKKTKKKPPYLKEKIEKKENPILLDDLLYKFQQENEIKKFKNNENEIRLLCYSIWFLENLDN